MVKRLNPNYSNLKTYCLPIPPQSFENVVNLKYWKFIFERDTEAFSKLNQFVYIFLLG